MYGYSSVPRKEDAAPEGYLARATSVFYATYRLGPSGNSSIIARRVRALGGKIIGAAVLVLLGLVLVVVGFVWIVNSHRGYTSFIAVGLLALLPGIYGAYEIIGTLLGWDGFPAELQRDDEDWTESL